jgi:hypothetical protein
LQLRSECWPNRSQPNCKSIDAGALETSYHNRFFFRKETTLKARVLASLAVAVLVAAAGAITAVLQAIPDKPVQPEPAQSQFDQPSIGKDPTAYGPLFKPNKPGKPGCNGPNCP